MGASMYPTVEIVRLSAFSKADFFDDGARKTHSDFLDRTQSLSFRRRRLTGLADGRSPGADGEITVGHGEARRGARFPSASRPRPPSIDLAFPWP